MPPRGREMSCSPIMSRCFVTVTQLSLLFLAIALATSRFTLVLHEIVGHGAMVEAVGADVVRYHLFWFAGGFIEFTRDEPYTTAENMAIFLGGIGLEMILGAAAFVFARFTRPGSIARLVLFGYAGIVLVHAGYYLTAGTYHGFGDGQVLYHYFGDDRLYLILPVTAALLWATHAMARHLVAHIRLRLPEKTRPTLVVGVAALVAAGGHAGLSFGELAIRPDPTYHLTMRHQSARDVERQLAEYIRAIESQRGQAPQRHELVEHQRELRRKFSDFPFAKVLVFFLALALLSGTARSGSLDLSSRLSEPIAAGSMQWKDLRGPGLLMLSGLALVGVLQAFQ